MIQLSIINILNSTHLEYIITDDDHSYELRKIKDHMNLLFKKFTTAIDALAIKIINDDLIIINVRYITHNSYAISVVPPFNRL